MFWHALLQIHSIRINLRRQIPTASSQYCLILFRSRISRAVREVPEMRSPSTARLTPRTAHPLLHQRTQAKGPALSKQVYAQGEANTALCPSRIQDNCTTAALSISALELLLQKRSKDPPLPSWRQPKSILVTTTPNTSGFRITIPSSVSHSNASSWFGYNSASPGTEPSLVPWQQLQGSYNPGTEPQTDQSQAWIPMAQSQPYLLMPSSLRILLQTLLLFLRIHQCYTVLQSST